MADMNLVRKQGTSLWPWLIGLVVLGLLIWAIAELVNTDRDNKTMAEADSAGGPVSAAVAPGTAPPPAAAQASPAAEQSPELTPAPLGALMPLGEQDVGQQVTASGESLTDTENGGFWLRTENSAVIWVRSAHKVEEGEQVQGLTGILRAAKPGEPGAAVDPDLEAQAAKKGWVFAPGLYLDASPAGAVASAGARSVGGRAAGTTKGTTRAKRTAPKR